MFRLRSRLPVISKLDNFVSFISGIMMLNFKLKFELKDLARPGSKNACLFFLVRHTLDLLLCLLNLIVFFLI